MRLSTMFIPIFHKKGNREVIQFISTKKMETVQKIMPSLEEVRLHIQSERSTVNKNNRYMPRPYTVYLNKEDHEKVINEIKKKKPLFNKDTVLLQAQTDSFPIIKLVKEDE